jgi:FlaG/FlaF family flagellin (archaellin)
MSRTGVLEDETGVSPVVGVVLLVGITMLLVAMVGSFVLDNRLQEQPPDVQFSAEERIDNNENIERVVFTFQGNDRLPKDELEVRFDARGYEAKAGFGSQGSFNSSESFTVTFEGSGPDATGEKIRLVWNPKGEAESHTVRTHTVTRDVSTTP